ncbi:MAG: hypothetical protein E5Y35_04305 [Mesorhizobium sp.]|uniref:hypothetical protein n=2 Tax=Mesorhizobium TaxID=68287 RepID=UPI000FD296A1|nr:MULTISPECIES: hypothetical protein [unclassified Mesorhizobium]RUV80882.1 hypothetical protein EOA51_32400 [Mesorhizobium sp. M1A.F.Ca.IN.020.32.1.1]RWF83191.1 MAG: hypothetical protein EOQ35_07135 [Mesorhizobium sp.]RWG06750.1 MAG: hypothetical protein EOQ38_01180 [Mesorhizobium sp.]RWG84051.1 MAG: hypothetical protein EOQ68_14745 [Mesorhizobium sp.]RWH07455.1 MAG: hypothetical protein EOQ73_01845 [Mesorhizobium sp.]
MTLNTMQIWRWFTPAALIIVYGAVIWFILMGTFPGLPDFSKVPYLIGVVVPAALYYITPLRTWVNKGSHERVTENLRAGMVKIAGYEDKPDKYTWPGLRSLFFKLVDDDKSLSTKASIAYFNGLLWTGFADSMVISAGYGLVSVGLLYFGTPNAVIALFVSVAILSVSYLGNRVATARQIAIGNEQLEHMRFDHKAAIERRLNQLDN